MNNKLNFLKTTLLGGVVFLLPLIVLVAVFGNAIKMMLQLTLPLAELLPVGTATGILIVNALAFIMVFFICFVAGLGAKSFFGEKLFQYIEKKLSILPGYNLFKARLTGNVGAEKHQTLFKTVLVNFAEKSQIAFEVERIKNGKVAIFLPGAPDPWSGSIALVNESQLEPINVDALKAIKIFENLGRGVGELLYVTSDQ